MEKVYRILDWLEVEQALDWLQDLTGTAITTNELLQLCESKQCAAYADVSGLPSEELGFDRGTAKGIHLVTNPLQAFGEGWRPSEIWTTGDTYTQVGATLLFSDLPPWKRAPIFQRTDILALAEKMNATVGQLTEADIEKLREQLKKVTEAKENAWHLTDKYKAELELLREKVEQADNEAKKLSDQLEQMKAKADHYQGALESSRAVVAELNVTVGHEQLARKYAEGLVMDLRNELEDEHNARIAESMERAESPPCACMNGDEVPASPMGITFPYATKQLEAMRDAALAHWLDHDRSKPAPYGIQKAVASFLADRTGQNSRKLTELAIAIKPDGLPKA